MLHNVCGSQCHHLTGTIVGYKDEEPKFQSRTASVWIPVLPHVSWAILGKFPNFLVSVSLSVNRQNAFSQQRSKQEMSSQQMLAKPLSTYYLGELHGLLLHELPIFLNMYKC